MRPRFELYRPTDIRFAPERQGRAVAVEDQLLQLQVRQRITVRITFLHPLSESLGIAHVGLSTSLLVEGIRSVVLLSLAGGRRFATGDISSLSSNVPAEAGQCPPFSAALAPGLAAQ